jgi:hypothetical protein
LNSRHLSLVLATLCDFSQIFFQEKAADFIQQYIPKLARLYWDCDLASQTNIIF